MFINVFYNIKQNMNALEQIDTNFTLTSCVGSGLSEVLHIADSFK